MHKLYKKYKELHVDLLQDYKWFVAFVGDIRHVLNIDIELKEEGLDYLIWAPCFQEYRKYHSDFILADRLLYAGYIFVGLKNSQDFVTANLKMLSSRKGYMLGTSTTYLKKEELDMIHALSNTCVDAPRMMFNVNPGDTITIKSGIFSGLCGKVKDVRTDGRVLIQAYFMNRDIEINMSVMDVQSMGISPSYDEQDD